MEEHGHTGNSIVKTLVTENASSFHWTSQFSSLLTTKVRSDMGQKILRLHWTAKEWDDIGIHKNTK